ncbi:hypothetical protein FX988_04351 (plasmid) [Paraglaciecola mesophila]|uniref:Uncharacterized protein n=1 Tax=Paraglaciecola mesophila TaxID=197222 RepID=A0A857JPU3_9ALTE|nr:hypothetical protein [Paraglaciecola mesophila]QHJ14069.1 hypothetical protein FX988_04351 [Paraglaciecola mesophila]
MTDSDITTQPFVDASKDAFDTLVSKLSLTAKSSLQCQDMQNDYINEDGHVIATHEMIACQDVYQVRQNLA